MVESFFLDRDEVICQCVSRMVDSGLLRLSSVPMVVRFLDTLDGATLVKTLLLSPEVFTSGILPNTIPLTISTISEFICN